jgi:hypothetical protein
MGPRNEEVSDELAKIVPTVGGKTEEHQVNMVSKGTVARDETSSGVEYGICVYRRA